jgi:glycosyltransferase involved in cell wall biosynthesis
VIDASMPLGGKTILLLPRYTALGPSSRLRMGQFVPMLEAAGATVHSAPFFDEDYLTAYFGSGRQSRAAALRGYTRRMRLLATVRADLAWVERELFPFLPGAFEAMLRWRRVPYVVDLDDAVFHRYDQHHNAVVRGMLGRKLEPLLRGAAAATMGNPYLVDYARRAGTRRAVEIPTVVDPDRYPILPPSTGNRLRLGWIGTPANARYLDIVIQALRRLGSSVPVTLVTIGASPLPDLPVPQEVHEWSEDSEGALLAGIDVGVMPLVDDPFERGKCGYKLIQYMAAGRAVIGSPVGVNTDIVTPECGLLANGVEEWMDAIRMLAADPSRRAAMGRAGRERVERCYSRDVIGERLIGLFTEIMA